MAIKAFHEKTQLRTHSFRLRPWLVAPVTALLIFNLLMTYQEIEARDALLEYQVKAAYLFNFLRFVEWPEDAFGDSLAPIVIGVVGEDPFGSSLPQVIIGKTVQGRDLVIRKYHAGDDLREAHILFISASERKRVPQILARLHGSSVLTVADMDGFLDDGGMIQFVMEDSRVRLVIDVDATLKARLKVNSKLLSLARVVTGAARGSND